MAKKKIYVKKGVVRSMSIDTDEKGTEYSIAIEFTRKTKSGNATQWQYLSISPKEYTEIHIGDKYQITLEKI